MARRRVNIRFLAILLGCIGLAGLVLGGIYVNKVYHRNPQKDIENARLMLRDQNYEQAINYFTSAMHANPRDAQTMVEMGNAYRKWSEINDDVANKDAICYLNALTIDPDNIDALAKVMTLYVSNVEFRHHAEDFDGLKNSAGKLVQLHPKDLNLYPGRLDEGGRFQPRRSLLPGAGVPEAGDGFAAGERKGKG
jgi:hypothetical protein